MVHRGRGTANRSHAGSGGRRAGCVFQRGAHPDARTRGRADGPLIHSIWFNPKNYRQQTGDPPIATLNALRTKCLNRPETFHVPKRPQRCG